jgi:hypothetical protein
MVSEVHNQVNVPNCELICYDNFVPKFEHHCPLSRKIFMTQDFIRDSSPTPNPETPLPSTPPPDNRHPLKVIVISSPQGVTRTIHTFYRLGYAHVSEWSKPQPTQNPGEVMSVLYRRLRID